MRSEDDGGRERKSLRALARHSFERALASFRGRRFTQRLRGLLCLRGYCSLSGTACLPFPLRDDLGY